MRCCDVGVKIPGGGSEEEEGGMRMWLRVNRSCHMTRVSKKNHWKEA